MHASLKTALIEDSRFVRAAANDRLRAAFAGVGSTVMPQLAYANNNDTRAPADRADGATLWGQVYGAAADRDSDGNAAAMNETAGGILAGADAFVAQGLRLGLLAGYGRSAFSETGASGSADSWSLGTYAGERWGKFSVRGGAAYTWHNIDTSRSVSFTGFSDGLSANYDAGLAQVFGEMGYRLDTGLARFEPYGAVAHVRLSTDGFTETGGEAALASAQSGLDSTFTTLGLRGETDLVLGEAATAKLSGGIGWRHAFGDVTPSSLMAFAGSSAFSISGVPIAREMLVVDLGAGVALSPTSTLGFYYSGQIAHDASEHGGKANLAVEF